MPFRRGAVSGTGVRTLLLMLLALPVASRALAGRSFRRSTWRSHSRHVVVGRGGGARRACAGEAGVAAMRSSEVKLEEMELWLDEIGVDRHGGGMGTPTAKLRFFQGRGIGLEANVKLERDSTVASIPRRVCFSSDPKDAPAGTLRAWAHDLVGSTPQFFEGALAPETDVASVTLQVFLERAAGARSTFAPWMALLGGRDDLNLPALWPASDLEALEGTLVQQEVKGCLARAKMERDVVAAAISDRFGGGSEQRRACRWLDPDGMEGRPTLSEWLHARCTVQSRAYRVGQRYLLIPLVDFANHDDDVSFAICPGDGVFTGHDEVVFAADRSYRPGQEICTSYGDMDNAKRLFSFGFVTLNRPAQRPDSSLNGALALPTEAFCDVSFGVSSADHLHTFKEGVLREHGGAEEFSSSLSVSALFPLTPACPYVSQLVEGPARSFVESIMPVLRLLALTGEELFREEAFADCFQPSQESTIYPDFENALEGSVVNRRLDPVVPVLAAGKGSRVLERLGCRFSLENERGALRLLEQRCSSRLREIRPSWRDVAALREASGESNEAGTFQGTFAASAPQALLCAAVRVGEAIAWHAILEACTTRSTDGDGCARQQCAGQTWASWASESCKENQRVD